MPRKLLYFIISTLIFAALIINLKLSTDTFSDLAGESKVDKLQETTATIPHFDHIVLIVMENKSYDEIVGSKNAPFINNLIKSGSLAGNYYAISHPSLPNYLAILGGSTFGITTDCVNCFISKTNLIDQLEKANKTWKAYFESLPNSCFLKSSYPYTRKYNSFVYFYDIFRNIKRCDKIVPYASLSNDLANPQNAPDFIWISPNLCNDMHYCGVDKGDKWLSIQIHKILNSPMFDDQNSLLILTWDEAETSGKNHITTIFIGKDVKKNYLSQTYYNHYSLLHTIEKAWNIPPLTVQTQKSPVMSEFFVTEN
ncbi:MAG: alkaline phosphatase family protein [Patescibacteria group bacterium]|nr:alkaline phosphatase family protein [Patescibacteria group bacterium]